MKSMVANSSSHQILRVARKIADGTDNKADRASVTFLGIDLPMAVRILAQFEEGRPGDIVDGVVIHNFKDWADVDAAAAFQRAVIKDTDLTIVTPEPGDVPKILNNGVGSFIGQFKSFAAASVNRTILLAGQQARLGDLHVYNGLALSVAMGMFVHILKSWQYDRDPFGSGAVNLIFNGVDRSGVGGLYMDGVHVGMRFGLRPPGVHLSRWAERDALGVLAGPSGGLVEDVGKVGLGVRSLVTPGERVTQSQVRAARRFVPYHQIFYLNSLFDSLEEGAADALNAKNRRR